MTDSKETQPSWKNSGMVQGKDKSNLIFLSAVAIVLLIGILGIPTLLKTDEVEDIGGSEPVPFSQMEDYSHATVPKGTPIPGPWTEDAELLQTVVDVSAGSLTPLEDKPLAHLLHHARVDDALAGDIDPTTQPSYGDMTQNAASHRGSILQVTGMLKTLSLRKLPQPNAANLEEVWEGSLIDEENRHVFFSVAEFPQNIYIPDQVVLTGYFMKIHGDPSSLQIGPMLVGRHLQLAQPPLYPLAGNDSILQKLVADDDPMLIEKINVSGREYLLHKVRTAEENELENSINTKIGGQEMIQLSRQVRGTAVQVKGILLLQPERERIPQNGSGLRNVYSGYMGNDFGIFRFTIIDPPLFARGDSIILQGYFLQRMSHIDQRNNRILTPMIIGQRLIRAPAPNIDNSDQRPVWMAAAVVLGILVMLFFLMQLDNKRSASFTLEMRKKITKPKVDLKESGRRLMAQREDSLQKGRHKSKPSSTDDPPADNDKTKA